MTSPDAADTRAILEVLAAEVGADVAPSLMVAAECQLFHGFAVVAAGQVFFLSRRFGAWEVLARVVASTLSGVEMGPAFGGGGYVVRFVDHGRTIRFGELDEATAQRLVAAISRAGGEVAKVAPRREAPRRVVASLAATSLPTSPLVAGIGSAMDLTSRTSSVAPAEDEDEDDAEDEADAEGEDDEDEAEGEDDEDEDAGDDAHEAVEAEAAAMLARMEARAGAGAASSGARPRPSSRPSKGGGEPGWSPRKILVRGLIAGVLSTVALVFCQTFEIPPYDDSGNDPALFQIVNWALVAAGGALACGHPTRLVTLAFWAFVAGLVGNVVAIEFGDVSFATFLGWAIVAWGYMRARDAKAAIWKGLAVGVAIRIVEGIFELRTFGFGWSLAIAAFWAIHFAWESAERGRGGE